MLSMPTIKIKEETAESLKEYGEFEDTWNDVIIKVLKKLKKLEEEKTE